MVTYPKTSVGILFMSLLNSSLKQYLDDLVKIHIINLKDIIHKDRLLIDHALDQLTDLFSNIIPTLRKDLFDALTEFKNAVTNKLNEFDAYLKDAISTLRQELTTTLNNHINNKSNPHNVTKAQLGVYSTAQVDSLLSSLRSSILGTGGMVNDGSDGKYSIGTILTPVPNPLPGGSSARWFVYTWIHINWECQIGIPQFLAGGTATSGQQQWCIRVK
jgi:hypothetical protein